MDELKWSCIRNINAVIDCWQEPAKTEKWAYEWAVQNFPNNPFTELVCFPWAMLLDLLAREKIERSEKLLKLLKRAPPKKALKRATVFQHESLDLMLDYLKALRITDVFWSHAPKNSQRIDEINIHPFPLYPFASGLKLIHAKIPFLQRKYQFSFIGAYDSQGYISDVRDHLFKIPNEDRFFIKKRPIWHFEKHIYQEQINQTPLSRSEIESFSKDNLEFSEISSQSQFIFCPSGSGCNSMRLWEAIDFGAIPIILSDSYHIPRELDQKNIKYIIGEESASGIEDSIRQANLFMSEKQFSFAQLHEANICQSPQFLSMFFENGLKI
jgi:hypothetical protein